MTVRLERVSFTINIKTSTLPELTDKIKRSNSASPMHIEPSVDVRGNRAVVHLEVEGLDKHQVASFQEWAEDFAKGLYY